MTKGILQSTRLPIASLRKIAEEIRDGENHWAKCHAEDCELDRLLGLSSRHPVEANQGEVRSRKARTAPVGMRKPTRDPIGLEAATV